MAVKYLHSYERQDTIWTQGLTWSLWWTWVRDAYERSHWWGEKP